MQQSPKQGGKGASIVNHSAYFAGLVIFSVMTPWDVSRVKIPTEDFTDVTLAIDDTYGDDVRHGDGGAGQGGWQVVRIVTWWKMAFERTTGRSVNM